MVCEWPTFSLREAGVTLIDCDHRTPPPSESGYPYIAIPQLRNGRIDLSDVRRITKEHFAEWTRKAKPFADDVVLSRRCNPGETAFVPPHVEFALGQNLVLLRTDGTKVHPPFLRWLVRGPEWWEQISKFLNVGALFDSLKCADVPNFQLRIPPLPEQRAIARILGTLDDKIELNRKMNETLAAMAQALFKNWFVDFEPFRDQGMNDSPLGEIPPTWSLRMLSDLVTLIKDRVETTSTKDNERYIALDDMPSKSIDLSRFRLGSEVNSSISSFKKGDILFGSMRPYFHKVGLAPFDGITRTTTFVLRPKKVEYRSFALLHFFSDDVIEFSTTASVGTTIPYVKWDTLGAYRIAVPSNQLLFKFERVVGTLTQKIAKNSDESHTLLTIRDMLLPKLLSGEIRVKDAERFAERAA